VNKLNSKLPISKLLDVKDGQYKIAVAAFRRVRQIAGNDRLRNKLKDSKRLPVVALANILNEDVKVIELSDEELKKIKESDSEDNT
jgi:DNA-directed RNA polymerase subunit K/omega